MIVVRFCPNGSWRLGLGFGVAAKTQERCGKRGISFRSLNLVGQHPIPWEITWSLCWDLQQAREESGRVWRGGQPGSSRCLYQALRDGPRRCLQQQPGVMDGAVRQPQMFSPSSSPVPRSLLAAGEGGASAAGSAGGSPLPSQACPPVTCATLLNFFLSGVGKSKGRSLSLQLKPGFPSPPSALGSSEVSSLELRDSQAFVFCWLSGMR